MEHKCFFFLVLIYLLIRGHGALGKNFSEKYLQCNGSIAGCQQENEMLMESEITRRILTQSRHISIGALSRNEPACSGGARGQAYSRNADCLPPAANPYHRGCSKYYRCRRDS